MAASIALFLAVVLFRVVLPGTGAGLGNFAPLAAIALCGAVWLPKRTALVLPLAALLVSDILLNAFHYHFPLFTAEMGIRYAALLLVCGIGFALRGRPSLPRLLLGTVAGSVLFYLVTNTVSWLWSPVYVKSASGWMQALTIGEPGYAPTWMFFRNSLAGDLFFTTLFAGCIALAARKSTAVVVTGKAPAAPVAGR